jgi:hypothetical protein
MADVGKQVAGELNTLLGSHGFRRSGLKFVESRNPEVVRTITISKFRFNTPGDYRFQLIASIYLATGEQGEFTFAGRAGRYSIVFERSAGYLLGDEALLYRVPESMPSEEFRERLRTDLEQRVLPFLASCDGIDSTVRVLDAEGRKSAQSPYSMQLAIALARLGRLEESRSFFLRTQGDQTIVRQVAAQYGITL